MLVVGSFCPPSPIDFDLALDSADTLTRAVGALFQRDDFFSHRRLLLDRYAMNSAENAAGKCLNYDSLFKLATLRIGVLWFRFLSRDTARVVPLGVIHA